MAQPLPPDDPWGDLLLVDGLPDLGLLDDLQLDCGLDDASLPAGLDGLEAGDLFSGAAAAPSGASTGLLDSLQLDAAALSHPGASSGTRHSPSGSGSDSPQPPPMLDASGVPALRGGVAATATGASPAASESDNTAHGRGGTPAATASQQRGGGAPAQPQRALTEEQKRMARMQRNRENAQLSRQRKKQQLSELEGRCGVLARQNAALAGAVQRLTAENATLRQQLALVCQQAGRAPATAPAAARQGSQPVAQPVQPAAAAAAARGLLPQWPVLPMGLLPRAAPPGQQPARAAATPAAVPAAARPAAAPAATARPAKRARTAAAGASTAFLALFTLFMVAGPLTPAPLTGGRSGGAGPLPSLAAAGHRALQALPDAATPASTLPHAAPGDASFARSGRALRALPAAADGNHSLQAPLDAEPPLGGGRLHRLLNTTLQALLSQPGNAAVEAAALQRLQELGPVALLLDADDPSAAPGSNPLAASAAFPSLAGQLFGAAGLEVPRMCRRVLEFDAASVPHAVRSRRSLERYVLGATGFKGRSLAAASGAADHRPQQQQPQQQLRIEQSRAVIGESGCGEEEEGGREGDGDLLPSGAVGDGPVLVSVLLPANASSGGGLSSADKVFVVLLHPQDKYAAYSCALPRPVAL